MILTLLAALALQCPDGSPPPCAGARRAAPPAPTIDSSTALIIPLQPVGSDPSLRTLGADLAAIIAENITAGDVRGLVAADLAAATGAARAQSVRRKRAGAFVEGTLIRLGGRVRATVRLVAASDGRELTATTVESSPDSLLAIADRLSVPLLQRWFEAQAGPHVRGGGSTDSLRALRHYLQGLVAWRRADRRWRAMLDSAVQRDPGFLAPLVWLGVSSDAELVEMTIGSATGMAMTRGGVMSPDSARTRARALLESASPTASRAAMGLPALPTLTQLGAGGASSPLSPMAAFVGCRGVATTGRTVEMAYLAALGARNASLAGCPESTATALAGAAFALDSSFVPVAELYFQLLIDRGDTARAREVLARLRALGQADDDAPAELAGRWAAELPDTSSMILALSAWRRFDVLEVQIGRFATAMGARGMSPMMLQSLASVLHLPLLLATGRHDSLGRVLDAAAVQLGGAARVPALQWQQIMGAPGLPVELLPEPLPAAALDSLLRDSLPTRIEGLGRNDPRMEMIRRTRREWVLRAVWAHGVLASRRNDLETARRLALNLDSAGGRRPSMQTLARGLRAEVALASGDTAGASQLIGAALEASALGAAVRYVWLGARLSAARGRRDVALALARSITMPSRLHGPSSAYYVGPALKLQGELLEQMGRRAEAAAAYRAFIELRRNADPPFQAEVEEIRGRLARLSP